LRNTDCAGLRDQLTLLPGHLPCRVTDVLNRPPHLLSAICYFPLPFDLEDRTDMHGPL
jgi:hypothetical protein